MAYSHSPARRKYTFVGIDPGTTIGVAISDAIDRLIRAKEDKEAEKEMQIWDAKRKESGDKQTAPISATTPEIVSDLPVRSRIAFLVLRWLLSILLPGLGFPHCF